MNYIKLTEIPHVYFFRFGRALEYTGKFVSMRFIYYVFFFKKKIKIKIKIKMINIHFY